MQRTQVQLTEDQARRVKEAARDRGISIAAYIREAVEANLVADRAGDARRRALQAIRGFRSDGSDVSRRHDEYLADAYAE